MIKKTQKLESLCIWPHVGYRMSDEYINPAGIHELTWQMAQW